VLIESLRQHEWISREPGSSAEKLFLGIIKVIETAPLTDKWVEAIASESNE
jgi:hypothetical protein